MSYPAVFHQASAQTEETVLKKFIRNALARMNANVDLQQVDFQLIAFLQMSVFLAQHPAKLATLTLREQRFWRFVTKEVMHELPNAKKISQLKNMSSTHLSPVVPASMEIKFFTHSLSDGRLDLSHITDTQWDIIFSREHLEYLQMERMSEHNVLMELHRSWVFLFNVILKNPKNIRVYCETHPKNDTKIIWAAVRRDGWKYVSRQSAVKPYIRITLSSLFSVKYLAIHPTHIDYVEPLLHEFSEHSDFEKIFMKSNILRKFGDA